MIFRKVKFSPSKLNCPLSQSNFAAPFRRISHLSEQTACKFNFIFFKTRTHSQLQEGTTYLEIDCLVRVLDCDTYDLCDYCCISICRHVKLLNVGVGIIMLLPLSH